MPNDESPVDVVPQDRGTPPADEGSGAPSPGQPSRAIRRSRTATPRTARSKRTSEVAPEPPVQAPPMETVVAPAPARRGRRPKAQPAAEPESPIVEIADTATIPAVEAIRNENRGRRGRPRKAAAEAPAPEPVSVEAPIEAPIQESLPASAELRRMPTRRGRRRAPKPE